MNDSHNNQQSGDLSWQSKGAGQSAPLAPVSIVQTPSPAAQSQFNPTDDQGRTVFNPTPPQYGDQSFSTPTLPPVTPEHQTYNTQPIFGESLPPEQMSHVPRYQPPHHADGYAALHHNPHKPFQWLFRPNVEHILGAILLIILFLGIWFLFTRNRRPARDVQPTQYTQQASLQQAGNRVVDFGQEFILRENEAIYIRNNNNVLKILGFAYYPCPGDPQCVEEGIEVNYELIANGQFYRHEFGLDTDDGDFPYEVRVLDTDYQTFARFVVLGSDGQVVNTSSGAAGNGAGNNGGQGGSNGPGKIIDFEKSGSAGVNIGVGSSSSGDSDPDSAESEEDVDTIVFPETNAPTPKQIIFKGKTIQYNSNWRVVFPRPANCHDLIYIIHNKLPGEVHIYETGNCFNRQITESRNIIEKRARDGITFDITQTSTDEIKKDIELIYNSL